MACRGSSTCPVEGVNVLPKPPVFITFDMGTAKRFELTEFPIRQKALTCNTSPFLISFRMTTFVAKWSVRHGLHESWDLLLKSKPQVPVTQTAYMALCETTTKEGWKPQRREMCTLAQVSTGLLLYQLRAASVAMVPTSVQNMALLLCLKILDFVKKCRWPWCLFKITSNQPIQWASASNYWAISDTGLQVKLPESSDHS